MQVIVNSPQGDVQQQRNFLVTQFFKKLHPDDLPLAIGQGIQGMVQPLFLQKGMLTLNQQLLIRMRH